ncbi:sperm flagellar protein 1-like [Castor canadensis]|uniref:Sperm flagellar protein 1-like n=1 Tax=Castor canadensis TaxID=51338 RepID=A0AC58MXI1_CASCN
MPGAARPSPAVLLPPPPGALRCLCSWLDRLPLSRPKRHLARDFSDGVLVAEIVKHFHPRLVDLHNYIPACSTDQKLSNWSLLNRKVFHKLQFCIAEADIHKVVANVPGAIEPILCALKEKVEARTVHADSHGIDVCSVQICTGCKPAASVPIGTRSDNLLHPQLSCWPGTLQALTPLPRLTHLPWSSGDTFMIAPFETAAPHDLPKPCPLSSSLLTAPHPKRGQGTTGRYFHPAMSHFQNPGLSSVDAARPWRGLTTQTHASLQSPPAPSSLKTLQNQKTGCCGGQDSVEGPWEQLARVQQQLEDKEQALAILQETVKILQMKVVRLEHLVKLKDLRIGELMRPGANGHQIPGAARPKSAKP